MNICLKNFLNQKKSLKKGHLKKRSLESYVSITKKYVFINQLELESNIKKSVHTRCVPHLRTKGGGGYCWTDQR